MYCEVKNDLFDLARRLKVINRDYRIYFNKRDNRFEIHTLRRNNPSGRTFAFVVPYDRLDSRVITYANKTRRENDSLIESEINEANLRTERSAVDNLVKKQKDLEGMLAFASRANRDIDFTKNFIKEF
jgi:hypothetical protein